MADLEERLRAEAERIEYMTRPSRGYLAGHPVGEPEPQGPTLESELFRNAADHISAQTQTITDLTRALERVVYILEPNAVVGPSRAAHDIARAALSSARSVSTE